ncbi:MAG: methyltransferase domain-containing protein [Chthoniobacterales bacterium]|nr:methyltransferase domain-containing protein [Chthoniobacterales bacterium]
MLADLPLTPPLLLPPGQTDASVRQLFASVQIDAAPKREIEAYWQQDWRRFLYTYGLVRDLNGSCLEIGANPYFTTTLLRFFTPLQLTLANYFGPQFDTLARQTVACRNPHTGEIVETSLEFHHFNIEDAAFPFEDESFDVVLFCEVLEHLQADPLQVLLEIKRVLKQGGSLILTTPNVARLENVCRMIAGVNIYDPYSGYGPYGRHNREYNKHDLARLLEYAGFRVEVLSSADVHENKAADFFPLEQVTPLVRSREDDLGQYLFSRSKNVRAAGSKRPAWLYRSYPDGMLE